MKKTLLSILVSLILLSGISGCASKPKPEATIITFLDAYKQSKVIDFTTVFEGDTSYMTNPLTTGTTPSAITTKMMELILSYDYEITKSVISKDGLTAVVSVKFTTVDLGKIFKAYITQSVAKTLELAFSGATAAQISQAMTDLFLEVSKDAPKDKVTTAEVKMVLVNKVWLIKGGEENLTFFDGIMGGFISTFKNLQTPVK